MNSIQHAGFNQNTQAFVGSGPSEQCQRARSWKTSAVNCAHTDVHRVTRESASVVQALNADIRTSGSEMVVYITRPRWSQQPSSDELVWYGSTFAIIPSLSNCNYSSWTRLTLKFPQSCYPLITLDSIKVNSQLASWQNSIAGLFYLTHYSQLNNLIIWSFLTKCSAHCTTTIIWILTMVWIQAKRLCAFYHQRPKWRSPWIRVAQVLTAAFSATPNWSGMSFSSIKCGEHGAKENTSDRTTRVFQHLIHLAPADTFIQRNGHVSHDHWTEQC